ncbi:toxin-antitoxin system YwqK family antitoxin [Cellulophaga baltica]|uniref:toxin-antitoxin system YwqK family antitoxin n=1 Tax=Cellulophaga baltica TaxID=76594 RepID=UPI0037C9D3FC
MKLFTKLIVCILCLILTCGCSEDQLNLNESDANLNLENGVLLYKNIPYTGVLVAYHQDGQLKSKINYDKGMKEGLESFWHQNGVKASERSYANNLKIGTHKGWWDTGTPKFAYHFNAKGAYDGNLKEWYKTGTLFKDFNYSKGKEAGSQKMWYASGKIRANFETINGERFGLIGLKKCYKVTVDSKNIK